MEEEVAELCSPASAPFMPGALVCLPKSLAAARGISYPVAS